MAGLVTYASSDEEDHMEVDVSKVDVSLYSSTRAEIADRVVRLRKLQFQRMTQMATMPVNSPIQS